MKSNCYWYSSVFLPPPDLSNKFDEVRILISTINGCIMLYRLLHSWSCHWTINQIFSKGIFLEHNALGLSFGICWSILQYLQMKMLKISFWKIDCDQYLKYSFNNKSHKISPFNYLEIGKKFLRRLAFLLKALMNLIWIEMRFTKIEIKIWNAGRKKNFSASMLISFFERRYGLGK